MPRLCHSSSESWAGVCLGCNWGNGQTEITMENCIHSASSKEGLRALTPLADGFCGTIWSLAGDWEYLSAVLKLPHYSSKASPCSLCKCTGGSEATSWKDCRPTAAWMGMQWTPRGCLGMLIMFQAICFLAFACCFLENLLVLLSTSFPLEG